MNKKNLIVIFSVTLMSIMGVASITPAFPTIVKHFGITPTQVTLLITVFTFPGIFLAPVIGVLADRIGRKVILFPSLLLFGFTGLGCFFTKNWEVLLALRFLQGIGATALGSLNITLIGDIYDGKKRGQIMGYNAAVLGIGTAVYPALGGALAMLGWQFPFLLPFLAIPTALLMVFWLKNPEPKIEYDFKEYIRKTWKNINRKTVWGLFIINILLFVVLYGAFLSYFPQMMEERLQATAVQIGLFMSSFAFITALTASQKKRIDTWISAKKQLNLSFLLYAFSMLILSFASNVWQVVIPLVAFGISHGILIPGIQTLLVGLAPLNERAGFISISGMVLRFGQTIGPVIIGLFYAFGGVNMAFIGAAAVAVVMLLVSFLMVKV